MTVQQTSLVAFWEVMGDTIPLTHTYQQILSCLKEFGPQTDMEIVSRLGYYDSNKIRPRRNELVKMQKVFAEGKKRCGVTGKVALVWRVKG